VVLFRQRVVGRNIDVMVTKLRHINGTELSYGCAASTIKYESQVESQVLVMRKMSAGGQPLPSHSSHQERETKS
jgi:hypothetical protein